MAGNDNLAYTPETVLNLEERTIKKSNSDEHHQERTQENKTKDEFEYEDIFLSKRLLEYMNKHKRILVILGYILLICLVNLYFIWASIYWTNSSCDIGWCNGYGLLILIVGITYLLLIYYYIIKPFWLAHSHVRVKKIFKNYHQKFKSFNTKIQTLILVIISLLPGIAILIFAIIDSTDNRRRLISLFGVFVIMLLGFIFSQNPKKIKWRPVICGLYMQFIMGFLTIRWYVGRQVFECIGNKVSIFLGYTDSGSSFVYGDDLISQGIFAFKVLPVIFFFSMIIQVLYYYGIMQWIVYKLGWGLQAILGTTVCESVNCSASVFLGMSEAPLLIKPYLADLTRSELHAIMVGGFSTVAGTVFAAYINFGVDPGHLITASVMSAPAALCYAKLICPEQEESKTTVDNISDSIQKDNSALDAASKGAMLGLEMVLGIIANLIAFISVVTFINSIIGWLGQLVGYEEDQLITLEWIMSKVFIPVAWIMGVDPEECEKVARLVGIKTMINEFVAYKELGELKKNNTITPRSEAIATYALCGFTNPGALGILIGSLSALAPNKRSLITSVAFRAFLGGCAVCFLTACIAGVLMTEESFPQ